MSFALAPEISLTETEHGMVLLDGRDGRYLMLNATGSLILRQLLGGATPDATAADLRRRFPAAADQVAGDVEDLLRMLDTAKVTTP